MKKYLDILQANDLDFEKFPEDKFPFVSFDLVKNEYFHPEKKVTYDTLAATDVGKKSKIKDGLIYLNNALFLNEMIKTPVVCTTQGIVLDFIKEDVEDDDYIFIPYDLFDVKLVKSHYSENPSLLLTGVDLLLAGNESDVGTQVDLDEMKFIYKKLQQYIEIWKSGANLDKILEISYCFGNISRESDQNDEIDSTNVDTPFEVIKEETPVQESKEEVSVEEAKDERIKVLEERLAQLQSKEENSVDKPEQAIENEKSKPIWKIIQEEFITLGTENIERKKLKDHILEVYPHIKQGTLSAQISLQVINKRARTGYAQCSKERVCGEDKLDYLFENEDGSLCRYNNDVHGIWEIYAREDGKLDVRLTE